MITGWRETDSAEQNPSVTRSSSTHWRSTSGEFGSHHPTPPAGEKLPGDWRPQELGSIRTMAEASLNRAQPVQDLLSHLYPLASTLLPCLYPRGRGTSVFLSYYPHDLAQSLPSSAFAAFPPVLYLGFSDQHKLASSKANRCRKKK